MHESVREILCPAVKYFMQVSQKQADSVIHSLLNLENVEDVENALVMSLTPKKGETI